MTWFIPILTTDNKTIYIATEKIRYIEDHGKERRIHCHSGQILFHNTPMSLEQLAHQLTSIQPPLVLVGYVGENKLASVLNIAYIAHVEANKKGNADIHCHYSNSRHIIKSQTPINEFLGQMGQAGVRFVGS